MKKILLVLALISLFMLVGCDGMSAYGIKEEQTCQAICLNEGLSLSHSTGTGDTLFCHCERIISIPNQE